MMKQLVARLVLASMVAVSGCVASLPFDDLTRGPPPISHYRLEETSGLSVRDSVGPNAAIIESNAENVLPSWTMNGKRGGGLDFLPDDGWIFFSTLSRDHFLRHGTISGWVRMRAIGDGGNDFAGIDEERLDLDFDDTLIEVVLHANNVVLTAALPGEEAQGRILTAPAVPLDTWALVAMGWDIPGNKMMLFVRLDGKDAEPPLTSDLPPNFRVKAGLLDISAESGTLDDVRIWDRILTAEELATL